MAKKKTPPMSDKARQDLIRRRGELVGLIKTASEAGDTRVASKFQNEMAKINSDLAVDDARRR